MINLIPQSAKKQIVIEYWLRVLTVWLVLLSVVAVVGMAIMFPVYILIKTQADVYRESADAAIQKIAVYENVSAGLIQSSQQAKIILDTNREASLTQYTSLFGAFENDSLVLSGFLINRDKNRVGFVQLTGTALNRQALADFRDQLLALEEVEKVDFPISNLAKDKDISFNMTVTLKQQSES